MTRTRARHLTVLTVLALAATALAGCASPAPNTKPTAQAATPYPVALHQPGLPKGLKIGVVVSLTSPAGQGAEWEDAAEGAALAAWQLQQGGTPVTVTTVNDKGTQEGAAAAVDTLAGEHVSAIIFATSGTHLTPAVVQASKADIPTLLPYGWQQRSLPAGVWNTGPSQTAITSATNTALTNIGATHPVAVTIGEDPVITTIQKTIPVAPGTNITDLTTTLNQQLQNEEADAVLVSGDATQQATVAAAFQGTGLNLPLVFTPNALSPAFPAALTTAAASLSGNYWTVGTSVQDSTALNGTPAGQAVSAFLAAGRQAATDPKTTNLTGDQPFSTTAAFADIPSHDALIAIAAAAAKAGSTDPAAISTVLKTLTLTNADGLTGPALNFTTPQALPNQAVTALHATAQDTGLRPTDTSSKPPLNWYPHPTK